MGSTPLRASATEAALAGAAATEDGVRAAADQAADGTNPPSDLNGDSDYRRHLATVLTRRAVLKAAGSLSHAADAEPGLRGTPRSGRPGSARQPADR